MGKLNFTKMVGAGNDFVVIDTRGKGLSLLAKKICERKTGIGADGMLVLEKSRTADFRMRIFNADGSEAEMCGNGLRCAVLFIGKNKTSVETKAGIYDGEITAKNRVKIRMEDPRDLRQDFSIKVNFRDLKVNYINTGVPHVVIFVEGLDKIDVNEIGRAVRYHKEFAPKGANVNFVEIVDDNNIKIRTYERGVEGETLACGTGSVAAAIISRVKGEGSRVKVNMHTRGGMLKVEFTKSKNKVKDVYLDGEAKIVFEGNIII